VSQNNPLQAYASAFFAPNSAQMLPQWFQSVDTDRSGKISVPELQVRASPRESRVVKYFSTEG